MPGPDATAATFTTPDHVVGVVPDAPVRRAQRARRGGVGPGLARPRILVFDDDNE